MVFNFPGLLKRQVTIFTSIIIKRAHYMFWLLPCSCVPSYWLHKTPNYGLRSLCLRNSSLCLQPNYSMFFKKKLPSGVYIPMAPSSLLLPHWLAPTELLPQVLLPQGVTVQCSAVLCSTVECIAVQCSAVQCSVVQCIAVQFGAVQCSAVK